MDTDHGYGTGHDSWMFILDLDGCHRSQLTFGSGTWVGRGGEMDEDLNRWKMEDTDHGCG